MTWRNGPVWSVRPTKGAMNALIEAREAMLTTMIGDMPDTHRHF
ncbi:hypothetical protein [Sphingobium sp. EM0848]|nr:hypothetical protein [Sphingobium sp. EM0848]